MAIRVLRILEYVYENEKVAEEDMSKWTHSTPVRHIPGNKMTMKSAVLPFEAVEWVDAPESD